MSIDLSKLQAEVAAHTSEAQRLLDSNEKHVAAAKAAQDEATQAQAAVDNLTQEIAAQTAAIKQFNDANGA